MFVFFLVLVIGLVVVGDKIMFSMFFMFEFGFELMGFYLVQLYDYNNMDINSMQLIGIGCFGYKIEFGDLRVINKVRFF